MKNFFSKAFEETEYSITKKLIGTRLKVYGVRLVWQRKPEIRMKATLQYFPVGVISELRCTSVFYINV